jgi:hypothetical protein
MKNVLATLLYLIDWRAKVKPSTAESINMICKMIGGGELVCGAVIESSTSEP